MHPPPALFMFFAPSIWAAWSLFLILASAVDAQGGEGSCKAGRCGNVSILEPFGLITGQQEENTCSWLGYQVTCSNNTLYFGYPGNNRQPKFQIIDIFYNNSSLLVTNLKKIGDFDTRNCHVPNSNTSSKLGLPFSISPVNQKLIFYNCTKAPAPARQRDLGLVETKCRNNTFARLEERYNESVYFLENCGAVIVPVRGRYGEANVSNYEQLISDGFLLSWPPPPPQSVAPHASVSSCNCPALLSHATTGPALPLDSSTVDNINTTTTSPFCEPVVCAKPTIGYPFWLADKHPPDCGYRAFQVPPRQTKPALIFHEVLQPKLSISKPLPRESPHPYLRTEERYRCLPSPHTQQRSSFNSTEQDIERKLVAHQGQDKAKKNKGLTS
uniref:Wall-associated receptor kinase galacturonan-binding domain-containing protein n=1 Tax=Oryza brachyantha TaxID=4533 RepID=J3KW86_ORYBR